jgi:hypothetical protein
MVAGRGADAARHRAVVQEKSGREAPRKRVDLKTLILAGLAGLCLAGSARADVVIGVDSPAARFSPATWSGDSGRGGGIRRTSWNNGAWCSFSWRSASSAPSATLHLTNATPGSAISYFADGTLTDNVAAPADGGITIQGLAGNGEHQLTVYLRNSRQTARWNGANAFTVTGLSVEDGAVPVAAPPLRPYALFIGDSITEGILADDGRDSNLRDYSFLVGQGLKQAGYDYAVSACGYSGWLRRGDAQGDVPAYYSVRNGVYDDSASRWNRIDAKTSLLDSAGHLSAYGERGQEPAAVIFNYMVNDAGSAAPLADVRASVIGSLSALRTAAPNAWIMVVVPQGLASTRVYPRGGPYIAGLRDAVEAYVAAHPTDRRVAVVDLGVGVANALASPAYGGGVHPNSAGHAFTAAHLLPEILGRMGPAAAAGKAIVRNPTLNRNRPRN